MKVFMSCHSVWRDRELDAGMFTSHSKFKIQQFLIPHLSDSLPVITRFTNIIIQTTVLN
jgi:hypothetical protein